MRGLGDWYLYEIALCLYVGSLLRHGFRNRLKCHLLQSIILSLSHVAVNGITLMAKISICIANQLISSTDQSHEWTFRCQGITVEAKKGRANTQSLGGITYGVPTESDKKLTSAWQKNVARAAGQH